MEPWYLIVPFPHVWQELSEVADRRGGDLGEDAGEVGLGIDGMTFGDIRDDIRISGTLPVYFSVSWSFRGRPTGLATMSLPA